jgi:hypothetical protein
MLGGRDRRSIGNSDRVAGMITSHPEQLPHLVDLLWDSDPIIAMRSADALEKVTREKGTLLQPYKGQLLGLMAENTQPEVKWHLAVMVPRMRLTLNECQRVATLLKRYLEDRSSIAKTFAMQGLYELARQDASLLPEVRDLIRALTHSGTPAMRARGRHLVKLLEKNDL